MSDNINQTETSEGAPQPRKKRLTWWKITLIILALLLALLILKAVLIVTAKPLVTITDEDLTNFSRPADYDPNEDAGPLYLEVLGALSDVPALIKDGHGYSLIATDPDDLRPISTWLREKENVLQLLERATSKPYFWRAGNKELDGGILPFINIGRALYCRAALSAASGQMNAACKDIVTCHKLARHFEGPLPIIDQIAGLVIRTTAAEGALRIISISSPDAQAITLLEQHFQSAVSKQSPVLDLRYEKLFRSYLIQRWFTDDGKGDGHVIPQGPFVEWTTIHHDGRQTTERKFDLGLLLRYPKTIWESATGPRKKQTLDLLERSCACLNKAALQTPAQTNAETGTEMEELIEKLNQNTFLEPTGWNSGLLSKIKRAHAIRTEELGCIVVLKILRFKLDKGRFPHNLQDLVGSGYFEELPMDPYGDEPFVYRRIGHDFTLYSRGPDFDDDGGVRGDWDKWESGDQVFWPVKPPE